MARRTNGQYFKPQVSIPTRSSLFIPDLVVIARDRVPADDEPAPIPASRAKLAVEITSPGNPDTDRKIKLWGYAHAQVPVYLLIDRYAEVEPTVSLYAEPSGGHYRQLVRVPFGEKVTLPDPFGFDLDTSRFRVSYGYLKRVSGAARPFIRRRTGPGHSPGPRNFPGLPNRYASAFSWPPWSACR